jgi:anthranilate/para-aminobenzoate synthase component I
LRSSTPRLPVFYFDYGAFKIFGSSPEAQVRIRTQFNLFILAIPPPMPGRRPGRQYDELRKTEHVVRRDSTCSLYSRGNRRRWMKTFRNRFPLFW